MESPNGVYEWLALAAAGAGGLALLLTAYLAWSARRIRRAQRLLLGGQERDLIAHAEGIQRDFTALRDWLEEAASRLDRRMSHVERRLDGAIAFTAMVRYDAYGEMSGRQSSSLALLDAQKNGVVLSAILHRNHSHLYVKNLTAGSSDIELSPEEQRAVDEALARGGGAPAEGGGAPTERVAQ